MNPNFHENHKYSVREIEEMRNLVSWTMYYKLERDDYGPIDDVNKSELEEHLRTFMLNGTSVRELQEAHDVAKKTWEQECEEIERRLEEESEERKAAFQARLDDPNDVMYKDKKELVDSSSWAPKRKGWFS